MMESNHPEIDHFSLLMHREMDANAHKGNWREFTDIDQIFYEIEWHKAKLMYALHNKDRERIQEYAADIANFYVMLLNATKSLYV